MFEQLKQVQKLQQIQSALKSEKITYTKNGVEITINGKLEIEQIKLNPALDFAEQEKLLKDAINEAMGKIQTVIAKKMQSMGGFGI